MSTEHLDTLKTFSTTLLKATVLIAVLGGLAAALPSNLTHINTSLSVVQTRADVAQT
jgi:hypothetical protein